MDSFISSAKKFVKGRTFKYFIPLLVLILGGARGLQEFTSLRYEFRNVTELPLKELEKELGKKPGERITLESAYEKVKKEDLDKWENIRGPRPWEENTEYLKQKQEKERRKKE